MGVILTWLPPCSPPRGRAAASRGAAAASAARRVAWPAPRTSAASPWGRGTGARPGPSTLEGRKIYYFEGESKSIFLQLLRITKYHYHQIC